MAKTHSNVRMSLRKQPYVFTELRVVMLSTAVKSDQAIEASIIVARIFLKFRQILHQTECLEAKYSK